MSFTPEEIEEFKVEALELLEVAEKSLLGLDQGAEFRPAFDAIFRCFHNLKGASGMMQLEALQKHTHELENILMGFKDASAIPKPHINLFLRGVDAARSLLAGKSVEFSFELTQVAPLAPESPRPSGVSQAAVDEFVAESDEIVERVSKSLQQVESGQYGRDTIDGLYRDIHSLKGSAYLFSFANLGALAHAMESSLEKVRNATHAPSGPLLDALFKSLTVIEALVKQIKSNAGDGDSAGVIPDLARSLAEAAESLAAPVPAQAPVMSQAQASAQARVPEDAPPGGAEAASSIRVPVALLDNLMTLMGEMVLVRNQVLQFSGKSEDREFLSMSKRLNLVTSEIQGEMMKTRMQPIGNVIGKFNRVVRDLSHELGKNITLNLSGSETELDKSLLEAIKDPLTHIVRNSCDHGIETPELRRAAGKSATGTLSIRAFHEGGQVVIEVSDDGKGLHKDVLLRKAMEKGILTPAQAEKLGEKQIFDLIFAPGFSTAASVTNLSGRGVGMDVVRTNIERIGGTVDLASVTGAGTTIRLKIPLTLAIVPALIVRCGEGKFAIPQVKLEELVRVDQSSPESRVETLHGVPVYRLRGNILPLVDLNQVLGQAPDVGTEAAWKRSEGILNIAVLNAESCSFGVIIDEIQDTADIVVKPLSRLLKSLQVYSGATVLGDGAVALILDVMGISKVAGIHQRDSKGAAEAERVPGSGRSLESQDYLLFRLNSPTKHAIVLGYLHRLEEFPRAQVELSGTQRVIRYGNVILPLISANEKLGYGPVKRDPAQNALRDTLAVLVIERAGKLYGIEVDEILDTFSSAVELDPAFSKHPGIFGNLNTSDELIVVVNPFDLITLAFPEEAPAEPASTPAAAPRQSARVLLVEDTVFFRKAMKTVLEKSGYEVVSAGDGQEALEILNRGDHAFDVIVSDIEMPHLNGFQLAMQVRKHPVFSKIPMLAISSRADNEHRREGAKAGFDMYLEKLKPSVLISSVAELVQKNRGAAA